MLGTKNNETKLYRKLEQIRYSSVTQCIAPRCSSDCELLLVAVQETEKLNTFLFIRSHINTSHPSLLFFISFSLCATSITVPKRQKIWRRSTSNHRYIRSEHLVCFLLGNSPASEFYMPTFRNTVPSS